jgi:hypothetical protein
MRRFLLGFAFIVVTAHRLPAPISEIPESPTPAPQESAQPKTKRTKARVTSEESGNQPREDESTKEHVSVRSHATKTTTIPAQPKFAGTWSGSITEFVWGTFDLTLIVNTSGTSVTSKSKFGTTGHATTCDGQTVKWREGVFNEVVWTFTPNSDGQTAAVTANSPLGIHSSTALRRTSTSEAGPELATSASTQADIPTAKPVPEKPGFVYNPFDPTAHRLLDVRGKASGTKVKDPGSGKLFIVP